MKKIYRGLVIFLTIHIVFLVASCNEDVECVSLPQKFTIAGFSIDEYKYEGEVRHFIRKTLAANDTISYDSMYLSLDASTQVIAETQTGGFLTNTFACSPIPPTAVDSVKSIRVFALERNGFSDISTTDGLTDKFDVIAFNEFDGFATRLSLSDYNSSVKLASSTYILLPAEQPEEIKERAFRVVVTFSDDEVLEASSKFLVLTP